MKENLEMSRNDIIVYATALLASVIFYYNMAVTTIWIFVIPVFLYKYLNWQSIKLEQYDYDWDEFYLFELKSRIKIALISTPIIAIVGFYSISNIIDYSEAQIIEQNRIAEEKRIAALKLQLEEERRAEALQIQKDSSETYYNWAIKAIKKRHYKTATINLNAAIRLDAQNYKAYYRKGIVLQKRRRYKEAMDVFHLLLNLTNLYESESYLEIGRCLLKLKRKKDAIVEVKRAKDLQNSEAKELYEKLNPMIRVISYYVTRCCDGSTSSASGRGACSHHGGVCSWNDPVYIKKRKYDY